MSQRKGLLLVISGPSGVGKSTIAHRLEQHYDAHFSVSMTTRAKTAADREGVDYYFVSQDRFKQALAGDELIEWATVFGNSYGTPRAAVEEQLDKGRIVILEIDVAGGKQVKQNFPRSLQLFIDPPNEQTLLQRLRDRGRDDEDSIRRRFTEAKHEIAFARHCGAYDHFLINDDLEKTIASAIQIIDKRMSRDAASASSLIFTRQQARLVDYEAINTYKIPGIVLMENAARQLADQTEVMLRRITRRKRADADRYSTAIQGKLLIICGPGNNGGDGLAAARHLHNRGHQVTIILTNHSDNYKADAATNLAICQAMKLPIVPAHDDPVGKLQANAANDMVIDGLFGTGLTETVREPFDRVIAWMNKQPAPILSIDIPSGLDCDTGKALGVAVKAAHTLSFIGIKAGFLQPLADHFTGSVTVADIGAPRQLVQQIGQPAS